VGRHSSLTPEVKQRFVAAIRLGSSRKTAARYAGISESTLYRWMADERKFYRKFRDAIDIEEATVQVIVVGNLFALSRTSTRAALAWLRVHGGPEWRLECPDCGSTRAFDSKGAARHTKTKYGRPKSPSDVKPTPTPSTIVVPLSYLPESYLRTIGVLPPTAKQPG
jgi:transposase-like protein